MAINDEKFVCCIGEICADSETPVAERRMMIEMVVVKQCDIGRA